MVVSFTELLAKRYRGKLDTQADEFIAYAADGSRRLQAMLDDLVVYLGIDTEPKQLQSTDCNALLQQVLQRLPGMADIQENTVTHDELPILQTDRRQLALVFHHLLDNAFKFRGTQPLRIHIMAQRQQHGWLFTVRDNGIGIEPRFSDRVFQLFQQLHEIGRYPGQGTGLALVKKIVERHGGRVWFESKPAQGATFHFTWECTES